MEDYRIGDMVDKELLGKRLKMLREESGLSQEQLAQCLSVDQSLISKFEKGERSISATQIDAICNIVCYPVERLLDEGKDMSRSTAISFRSVKLSLESLKALSVVNRIFLNQMRMDDWSSVGND